MSRIEELSRILAEIQASSGDVEACAVVSSDGLIMASALPHGVEEARVAAMSVAILSIGSRAATELKRGTLNQLFLRGDDGYIVIMQAGPHAALIVLARKEAMLGLLFLDVTRAAERAAAAIG